MNLTTLRTLPRRWSRRAMRLWCRCFGHRMRIIQRSAIVAIPVPDQFTAMAAIGCEFTAEEADVRLACADCDCVTTGKERVMKLTTPICGGYSRRVETPQPIRIRELMP